MESHQIVSQKLLAELRASAKKLAKDDKTKTHVQHLNVLARRHGARTFEKLKQQVAEVERLAHKSLTEEEEKIWEMRLNTSTYWGSLEPYGPEKYDSTVSLPNCDENHVPWPHCISSSSLFSPTNGPRKQIDGKLVSEPGIDMHFEGEELRTHHDQILLMAIMILAGEKCCGEVLRFSLHDLEALFRRSLNKLGMPISAHEITRTLWRLTNCELTVGNANFSGPIFIFADAAKAPKQFRVRFNPKLPNLFLPIPIW